MRSTSAQGCEGHLGASILQSAPHHSETWRSGQLLHPWRLSLECYAVLRFLPEPPHPPKENSVPRPPIDLTSHLNQDVTRGHLADFPVTLRPIYQSARSSYTTIPKRQAVVREDTGHLLAIGSDRYTLVPHARILELVED